LRGLNKATQGSAATYSPLAYERIQWDGLHARRSFEISGADNRQTLHSDTDAAVLDGNTAPWLFNRTQYANGLGSTSSTTQLHADSNGNLVATVASEGGTAKADSLLLYGAYGSVDSESSGNAGVGLKSNGHSFGSYYADPETGLLYARARYYDPASGQFISRDPVEGEARLPITWGAYQYGRYNPYRYTDPNGECDSWRDCGTKIAGGLVGGIGLTAVKAVEGTLDTARFIGDGYLGLLGSEAAQRRNSERLDLINGVIDNAGQLPSAVRQAIANIDEKAQAEDANGNTFTAAMLRGNYAGEIGLAIAGLPQAARSAASLADKGLARAGNAAAKERVVARALARELQATEPVLAAKAPEAPQVRTVDVPKDTTRRLLNEGDKLETEGKRQSNDRTALSVDSATGERGSEVVDRIANESAALRSIAFNNSSDASKILHQRINLKGAVLDEYSRMRDGLTNGQIRNEIGPVLAGVMDSQTGNVYFGINKMAGELPSNFVSEIAQRMPEAMANSYFKTHGAGTHAEIHALNDAFLARPSAVMSDFHLYTINSGRKTGGAKKWGMPVPRCPHCEILTNGVQYFPSVMRYEK
jgi:RHS repeat-associated protein